MSLSVSNIKLNLYYEATNVARGIFFKIITGLKMEKLKGYSNA